MIEILLIGAVFGFIVLVGCAIYGLVALPRRARPEVAHYVRGAVGLVLAAVSAAAFYWVPFMQNRQKADTEETMASYCTQARETIFHTVRDVDGLLVRVPGGTTNLHADDMRPDGFLDRPDHTYGFVEFQSFGSEGQIRHHEASPDANRVTVLQEPTADYGLTWTSLTSIDDMNAGLFGDETVVYELATKKILARRLAYYRVEPSNMAIVPDAFHSCPNVDLGKSRKYIDGHPRESYAFVSRVLIPTALAREENIKRHDLAPGSGIVRKDCLGTIRIGQGIGPKDVTLTHESYNLVIERTGTADALVCQSYFFPAMQGFREGYYESAIRFVDGAEIKGKTLDALPQTPVVERPTPVPDASPSRSAQESLFETQQRALREQMAREIEVRRREAESPSSIKRWVDKDGQVHYSDR